YAPDVFIGIIGAVGTVVALTKFLAGLHLAGQQATLQRTVGQNAFFVLNTVGNDFFLNIAPQHAVGHLIGGQRNGLLGFFHLIGAVVADGRLANLSLFF